MAGTIEGGRKAAITNKLRYGNDVYEKIGALGGMKSTGGGFSKNPELARAAGRKGGSVSRKYGPHALKTECKHGHLYDEENTGTYRNGHRYCKACSRLTSNTHNSKKQGLLSKLFN
jgi:uncharacterized protein